MIPNHDGFMDGLPELSAKEMKKGGGISFLTKLQRLEMKVQRQKEKQQQGELSLQKMQADLMLAEDESSDEDRRNYKITAKDYEILQKAKLQEGVDPGLFAHQD